MQVRSLSGAPGLPLARLGGLVGALLMLAASLPVAVRAEPRVADCLDSGLPPELAAQVQPLLQTLGQATDQTLDCASTPASPPAADPASSSQASSGQASGGQASSGQASTDPAGVDASPPDATTVSPPATAARDVQQLAALLVILAQLPDGSYATSPGYSCVSSSSSSSEICNAPRIPASAGT